MTRTFPQSPKIIIIPSVAARMDFSVVVHQCVGSCEAMNLNLVTDKKQYLLLLETVSTCKDVSCSSAHSLK